MNKKIFASEPVSKLSVNQAGGKAYDFNDQHALAQLVVTGCLNDTFYATAENQLEKIKELAEKCSDEYIAKAAVYAHKHGKMKDAPAVLLGIKFCL